jgi:hypothetical protein
MEGMQMAVEATWHASLDCECPGCNEDVDLLDDPDFWDGRNIEIAEHGTLGTTDMEVVCPLCGHVFAVDCQW